MDINIKTMDEIYRQALEREHENKYVLVCDLIKVDFDNLENRVSNALIKKTIRTFRPNEKLSALGVLSEWLKDQEPFKMYVGWFGQIYPKLIIEERYEEK